MFLFFPLLVVLLVVVVVFFSSPSHVLVDQAALVSSELIRVAILWHEMWHEGLEEASRLYFGKRTLTSHTVL